MPLATIRATLTQPVHRLAGWAFIGSFGWMLLFATRALHDGGLFRSVANLLLVAPLATVPLLLSLIATPDRQGRHPLVYRVLSIGIPVASIGAAWASMVPRGWGAAALALPWFGITVLVALYGLQRLMQRGLAPLEETCIDVGLLYTPVGGVWLLCARAGIDLMGFSSLIVLLTAVHFHYAGLAAPVIAGLVGRALAQRNGRLPVAYTLSALTVMSTPILVAIGITASPLMEVVCAVLLAVGLVAFAVVQIVMVARGMASWLRKGLLIVSGLSLLVTMTFAVLYALSAYTGTAYTTIPQMVVVHGITNVFGFTVCGLLAWAGDTPPSRAAAPSLPLSTLQGHGSRIGPTFFEDHGHIAPSVQPVRGFVADLDAYAWESFDPGAVHPWVRAFYEHTEVYDLHVRPRWHFGFRLAGRLFRRMAARLGQLGLPTDPVLDTAMQSRLLDLSDARDGRSGVRGWVRTYAASDEVAYAAAYARHVHRGIPYMNIAFPLPHGNLTSILRLEHPTGDRAAGLRLTTRRRAPGRYGDEGVYYGAGPRLYVRLPLRETIEVWPDAAPGDQSPTVRARHRMWCCGLPFLTLDYDLVPSTELARSPGPLPSV